MLHGPHSSQIGSLFVELARLLGHSPNAPTWAVFRPPEGGGDRRYPCGVTVPSNLRDPAAVVRLLEQAAQTLTTGPSRTGSIVRLPARGRLLATGDLHDNPVHLGAIIKLAQLDRSPDHHVVLHELIHGEHLINGMDFSHRMLCRVAELVVQFPGQVHPLLANHELSQLMGRGVSKGAGNSVVLFEQAVEYAFGDDAETVSEAIHAFIRAMPLALTGGPQGAAVLCAHSLPAPLMMKRFDPGVFERQLSDHDYRGPFGSAYLMTWGRQHTQEQIEQLAKTWGIKLFCIGHEHVPGGIDLRHGRVIILNSDHEFATALPLDLAAVPDAEQAMSRAIPLRAVS